MEKNSTITIRISETEKEALRIAAGAYDIPMSQVIREAIRDYIKKSQEVK